MKLNIKILMIILLIIVPTAITVSVSGYANRGNSNEGVKIYVVSGMIDTVPASVIVVSEVANGSQARGWEVVIIVQPESDEIAYLTKIQDNHMALDGNFPDNGDVLGAGEGEEVGTSVYGPWAVYANGDPAWGDLIWTISVLSLDGKELYIQFIMRWGYGADPPIKIEYGDELDDAIGDSGEFRFIHVVLGVGGASFGGYHALEKSKKKVIPESSNKIRVDDLE